MQKAIEEAKRFVCTTKDRIVKDAKEFIQNVDWKKVAIGVAGTLAVTAVVVATGGAAAPVLIGAAVGAGIGTGTTIVSGAIQGKSPAEIAKDASGAFMWGAIGGAVGGGTTQVLKNVGSKALGKVGKKLVEDGVDMAVDLTQTATENGGLTGKDILFSAVSSFGGDLLSSVKTNSSTKDLFALGLSDNKAVKDAVEDSLTDNKAVKNAVSDIDTPKIHGNSKNSTKIQHGYEIYDDTGNAVKTGISGQSLNKNGTSPRANSQVNKWNKEAGYEKYSATVVETNMPDRSTALEWERNNTNRLAQEGNDLYKHVYPKPNIN